MGIWGNGNYMRRSEILVIEEDTSVPVYSPGVPAPFQVPCPKAGDRSQAQIQLVQQLALRRSDTRYRSRAECRPISWFYSFEQNAD